jgi:hypothetical protein
VGNLDEEWNADSSSDYFVIGGGSGGLASAVSVASMLRGRECEVLNSSAASSLAVWRQSRSRGSYPPTRWYLCQCRVSTSAAIHVVEFVLMPGIDVFPRVSDDVAEDDG